MSSRLQNCFSTLKGRGEKALVAFVTAGDPSLDATRRFVVGIAQAGADVIELGIPFSDPLLDGPVIQAASQRALDAGTRVQQIFNMVESLRAETDVPLIFMTCLNPIHRMGLTRFAGQCRTVGVDGVLVTDMPPEEGHPWMDAAMEAGLDRVFMLAPTSSPERISAVAGAASGFIYCQSQAGVTGIRQSLPPALGDLIRKVRGASDLPLAVGFGISTPDHVRAVTAAADAAVVGTAYVRAIAAAEGDVQRGLDSVVELTRQLKSATWGE